MNQMIALDLGDKERVSNTLFYFVVIVDRHIHENAAVEAEGSTLFGFGEDICPHDLGRAVDDLQVAIVIFVANKVISTFDVLSTF